MSNRDPRIRHNDGFEAAMGDNGQDPSRQKAVTFMSISPLDRLLNQKDRNDKIRVGVSCRRDETSASSI